jgi:beta-1,2-mannobiose phosphorylase / 1,2-beta-oligomannan phosphorylase
MMMYGDSSRRGRPFAKDPAVVRFKGHAWLYYSIPPYGSGHTRNGTGDDPPWPAHAGWGIGIARSDDLKTWVKVGEILAEAGYEENGLCAPGALVLGDSVHLFYQTYGNGPKDAICHAVSEDGMTFERNPTNPIFAPTGDWTCGRAIDADVAIDNDRLLLYFATRDPTMTTQMLGVAAAALDSGFRRDAWTQLCDEPILKPELAWEQECIEAPAVCRHEGRFFMWYGGAYNNMPQQIGCAVSDDGLHWHRLQDKPFLPNGEPGSWNACESGHPYVFVDDDGQTYLFYQGNNDLGKTWLLSMQRIVWREGRPLLAGPGKS